MEEQKKEEQKYVNPITGKHVDECITEKEAKERGYLNFEFMLRYLEDENEYVKFFIIEGKHIIVDIAKPNLQYKHKPSLSYERLFKGEELLSNSNTRSAISNTGGSSTSNTNPVACSMDEGCVSCGS